MFYVKQTNKRMVQPKKVYTKKREKWITILPGNNFKN